MSPRWRAATDRANGVAGTRTLDVGMGASTVVRPDARGQVASQLPPQLDGTPVLPELRTSGAGPLGSREQAGRARRGEAVDMDTPRSGLHQVDLLGPG